MKVKDLVVGQHYYYHRPFTDDIFEVAYDGRISDEHSNYFGEHDFSAVNGDFIGAILPDDELEIISEMDEGE